MNRNQLKTLTDLFAEASLDAGPMAKLLTSTADREAAVRAAARAAVAEADSQAATAADQVAADPSTFAGALHAVVHAEHVVGPSRDLATAAKDLQRNAIGRIYIEARAAFAKLWSAVDEKAITDHDRDMSDLTTLAPTLAGIVDDKAAVRAGHPTATAWAKADTIAARREAMIRLRHQAATVLGLADYDPTDDLRQYRHPERLRAWPAGAANAPRHRVTVLLDDLDAGAEPALCTDAEVAATIERCGEPRPPRVNPFGYNPLRDAGRYPQPLAG